MNELAENYEWVFRLVEVIAIVVGVIFVAIQTSHMRKSISEIQKGFKLEKGSAIYRYSELINPILIEHSELARGFDLTQQDVLAYMIIAEFARLFHLHEEGMIEDSQWNAFKGPIKATMNREWVKEVWGQRKGDGRVTTDEFEKFIETLAYSNN